MPKILVFLVFLLSFQITYTINALNVYNVSVDEALSWSQGISYLDSNKINILQGLIKDSNDNLMTLNGRWEFNIHLNESAEIGYVWNKSDHIFINDVHLVLNQPYTMVDKGNDRIIYILNSQSNGFIMYNINLKRYGSLWSGHHRYSFGQSCLINYNDKHVYVLGGFNYGISYYNPTNMVHLYNIENDTWSIKSSFHIPRAMFGCSMNKNHSNIYIFSGKTNLGKMVKETETYNIESNMWHVLTNPSSFMNPTRIHHKCIYHPYSYQYIICIGGNTNIFSEFDIINEMFINYNGIQAIGFGLQLWTLNSEKTLLFLIGGQTNLFDGEFNGIYYILLTNNDTESMNINKLSTNSPSNSPTTLPTTNTYNPSINSTITDLTTTIVNNSNENILLADIKINLNRFDGKTGKIVLIIWISVVIITIIIVIVMLWCKLKSKHLRIKKANIKRMTNLVNNQERFQ